MQNISCWPVLRPALSSTTRPSTGLWPVYVKVPRHSCVTKRIVWSGVLAMGASSSRVFLSMARQASHRSDARHSLACSRPFPFPWWCPCSRSRSCPCLCPCPCLWSCSRSRSCLRQRSCPYLCPSSRSRSRPCPSLVLVLAPVPAFTLVDLPPGFASPIHRWDLQATPTIWTYRRDLPGRHQP